MDSADRTGHRTIVNIPITEDVVANWRAWFTPSLQPFPRPKEATEWLAALPQRTPACVSDETRDTFYLYGGDWVWLTRTDFAQLPEDVQRTWRNRPQLPVIWDLRNGDAPLWAWVRKGLTDSCHDHVPPATWHNARHLLPRAQELTGSFPPGSGPNCFGTVMACAGVPGAEDEWVLRETFEEWLHASTEPAPAGPRHDHEPGIVLVWRNKTTGDVNHAAVTLGDGWAASKPSQSWYSPRVVWSVRHTIKAAREPGDRLTRYRINNPN